MYVLGSCGFLVIFVQAVLWTPCLGYLVEDKGPSEGQVCHMGLTCGGGNSVRVELPVQGIRGPAGLPGLDGLPGIPGQRGPPGKDAPTDCHVAFYAAVHEHVEYHAEDDITPLMFDAVLSNNGNAFDKSFSNFTAPSTGTYMFHATVSAKKGKKAAIYVMHNSHTMGSVWADSTQGWGSSSDTYIIDMLEGDTVRVTMRKDAHAFYGGKYTSFSGLCLWNAQPKT